MPSNGKSADATAHVQMSLGAIPAIATLPVAALTARDSVASTSVGIHNADASTGGITVQAGRSVVVPNARFTTAPGGLSEASVIENDASLAALDADHLFVSFFGVGKALWRQQPGVKSIRCDVACTDYVLAAAGAGHRMIWIDGDAELSGPIGIGKRDRPVVVVASGALRLIGPVSLHGVIYAGSIAWQGAAGGQLRGAAISESGFTADAAADLVHDAVVLASLKTGTGSFARIPGSWRDF